MMQQYLAIKAKVPDALLFYRMGDFYELFLRDAEVAAPLLDIALTTRDKGKPDAIPMCGVPVHGVGPYLKRLAGLGHRVAICEQIEDAAEARRSGRRLVRRDVVEVVTPGLVGDPEGIEAHCEVTLAALAERGGRLGLALLEASTGDFRYLELERAEGDGVLPATLIEELHRVGPRELLLPEAALEDWGAPLRSVLPALSITPRAAAQFETAGIEGPPEGFDAAGGIGMDAGAALLRYLADHQPSARPQLARLRPYSLGDTMVLDAATRRHLELFENQEEGTRRGTLIDRIDVTTTPLGARRLARWLAYPLLSPAVIRARHDAVEALAERDRLRRRVREAMRGVRDLERLLHKAGRPNATPRDLVALRTSLEALDDVARLFRAPGDLDPGALSETGLPASLPIPRSVPEAQRLLGEALVDEPPAVARGSRGALEIGYIRPGFRSELDALRDGARKGREWIAGLEGRERERTGIANLKVRFHPVHGYALEVGKAQLGRVPDDYERRQTLANAERFTTPELREMEVRVRGAHERAAALERELFEAVRAQLRAFRDAIAGSARAVADLDALASLSEVARRDDWTRPIVTDGEGLDIEAGRHPVVEPLLRAAGNASGEEFVPNDTSLHPDGLQILVLTGPNMSGKSTYLRQVALIALLAQIGSFVPASRAEVGVIDRIFTRVGASDRLAQGESTFMVEMRETAEILAHASRRSLVILDEIGRGTSTYDGLSIAWAVAEYLHNTPGLAARTLFATHYHELTELSNSLARVGNAHFEVREWGEEVLFLRRLVPGGANRSYGIAVARLAGLPGAVTDRAVEILGELEARGATSEAPQLALFRSAPRPAPDREPSPSSGAERAVLAELRGTAPDRMRPVDALVQLAAWRERLNRGSSQ